jgi:hypothetical protein
MKITYTLSKYTSFFLSGIFYPFWLGISWCKIATSNSVWEGEQGPDQKRKKHGNDVVNIIVLM